MKIIIFAILTLAVPVTVLAAPAQPQRAAKSAVKIDAGARAIFARAVKVYGATKGLKASWTGRVDNFAVVNSSMDFDRAGRLRLVMPDSSETLIVVSGETRWSLIATSPGQKERPSYAKEAAYETDEMVAMGVISPELSGILRGLLVKSSPLDAERVQDLMDFYALKAFRAESAPPQILKAQPCDLVRITLVSSTSTGRERLEQRTFWFSHSDARLMRLQIAISHGGKQKSVGDWQIINQTFDPKFAPNTFKFTPPKGAVLLKD